MTASWIGKVVMTLSRAADVYCTPQLYALEGADFDWTVVAAGA